MRGRVVRSGRRARELVCVLLGIFVGCREATNSRSSSTVERCGDGVVRDDGSEACDDGNTLEGDGCSAACGLELGWACRGSAPSKCIAVCGDGLRRDSEACDSGAGNGAEGCTSDCRVRRGWACNEDSPSVCGPVCGDGVLLAKEQCDDGNRLSGDGCDVECRTEVGFACDPLTNSCAPICGDGQMVGTETCDDANTRNGDGCNALCARVDRWRTLAVSAAEMLPANGLISTAGNEVFMFGDNAWAPRAFNPTTRTWRFLAASGVDDIDPWETGVAWTGREIVAFIRDASYDRTAYLRIFDPQANRWREASRDGLPDIETPDVAVWAGTQLLMWGQAIADGRSIGGRYDPARDAWSPMRSTDIPAGVFGELKGVWTGAELVIVSRTATGELITGAYDPTRDEWRSLPSLNAPALSAFPLVTWTGADVIVLSSDLRAGAAYRPSTNTWRTLPLPSADGLESSRSFGWALWTGSELAVVSHELNRSLLYEPASDSWRPIEGVRPEELLGALGAVVVGGDIVVHCGKFESQEDLLSSTMSQPAWFRLDATTTSWVELQTDENLVPDRARGQAAFFADGEVFLFGGARTAPIGGASVAAQILVEDVWGYSIATGSWARLSTEGQPESRANPLLVWSGTEVIIWGGNRTGFISPQGELDSGGRYDPRLKTWRPMSPGDRRPTLDSLAVWSGQEMFVWSPPGEARNEPPFAAYDPLMDTWRDVSDPDAPEDGLSGAVLAGNELLFHGISGVSRYDLTTHVWRRASMENSPLDGLTPTDPPVVTLGDGQLFMRAGTALGRYDLARDTWQRVEVPEAYRTAVARSETAMFTGAVVVFLPRNPRDLPWDERMREASSPIVGVMYDPRSGRWSTTPTLDAPLVDADRTYTWTGSELVVWGGELAGGVLPL